MFYSQKCSYFLAVLVTFMANGCEISITPEIPFAEDTGNPYWDTAIEDVSATRPDVERDSFNGNIPTQEDSDVQNDPDTPFFEEVDSSDVPSAITDPPLIYQVWPSSGTSLGGTQIYIDGMNFSYDATILLGGVELEEVDVIDSYQIWATTRPMPPNTYDLKIITDAGSALFEDAFTFEMSLSISEILPTRGPHFGGFEVDLYGTGFREDTRFLFSWNNSENCSGNGTREASEINYVDPSHVILRMPEMPGSCVVDLLAFDDRFERKEAVFSYYENPSLDRIIPDSGSNLGGQIVQLLGSGFDEECIAHFGMQTAPISWSDEFGWITVAPAGSGTVAVVIDCILYGSGRLSSGFSYTDDFTQRLTRIRPTIGPANEENLVTIMGFGLENADQILLDDQVGTILTQQESSISFLSPSLTSGRYNVHVHVDDTILTLENAYTVFSPPILDSIRPTTGPPERNWIARIDGSNLTVIDEIWIGSQLAEIVIQEEDEIGFQVPPGPTGEVPLSFSVGEEHYSTSLSVLRRHNLSFSQFFPEFGTASGGSEVYVAGRGFSENCEVRMDGEILSTRILGESLLVATTMPHSAGEVSVEVIHCEEDEDWISNSLYEFVNPTRYPGGVGGDRIDGELHVSVRDIRSFEPIEGASVVVGVRDDTEWSGVTGADGLITFRDPELVGPQTITAFAPERSVESIYSVNAQDVTLLLYPIPDPPSPPCDDPEDPACAPPPPEPVGEIIGFLSGMYKIFDFPPGTSAHAVVETTRYLPNYGNPGSGEENELSEDGPFSLTTRFGEMALVALCGYKIDNTGEFVPLMMGVERGIRLRPGDDAYRTTIECSIPLSEQISVKMTQAPEIREGSFPEIFRATATFDLGADGVFQGLPAATGTTPIFTSGAFPALTGPLSDVTFNLVAGAYLNNGSWPRSETYLYGLNRYDELIVTPAMLSPPRFVTPEIDPETNMATLIDGYVEWEIEGRQPDLFHLTIRSQNADFKTWSVYVPGWRRDITLSAFPQCQEDDCSFVVPQPGDPERSISFYVRAVDTNNFDMNNFDRYVLNSRDWRASATTYQNIMLTNDSEAEEEEEEE